MPLLHAKQRFRKLQRTARGWMQVINMTLEGNHIDKKTTLHKAEHPVLLIQGMASTRRTFSIMERRLQRDGYCVFSLHLGGMLNTFNSRNIEELSIIVREKVEALYKKYKFKGKISIIGHSKGGLIGRYYIQCLGGHNRVRHLITLGTPHNGNPWALLGSLTPIRWIVKSLKDMTPLSSLIKTLQEMPFPDSVLLTSIYSHDDMINPYPSAIVDYGEACPHVRNICIDGTGHLEFLIKKSVYGHVKRALRAALPARAPKLAPHTSPAPQLRLLKAS